ncbi:hypothetical protein J3P96_07630 [Pseudomonas sp. R3-56]|uniref:hypothetical protein n=1 Tax=Pseudomonas sp. R3-56 TaxID=2817401 RepID=UPI003DA99E46
MANADTRMKRQEAHSAYLRMRSEHRSRVDLEKIIIDSGNYADEAKGLLKGPVLQNGLIVKIPKWANPPLPGKSDRIEVKFAIGSGRFDVVAEQVFEDLSGPFPYEMVIGNDRLPQSADCRICYVHYNWENNETESPITPVICDQVPPYNRELPKALKFVTTNLDDSNLPAGSNLTATIPGYPDWQATDKIYIFLVDAAAIPEDPTGLTPIFFGPVPDPGSGDASVQINGNDVRDFGDAECVFMYVLQDEATNFSAISDYEKMTLTFGPLPDDLLAPEIPQADPGPLVAEHALAGVSVWIPRYDNHKRDDEIQLSWGNTDLGKFPVGNNPPEKIEIPVSPALLMLQEYGEGTTGNKPTEISYQVIRKGRPFGPQSKEIQVDFEVPIPWIPWPPLDWPDPVHPSLVAGEVRNHDDSRTNELARADKNEDATFAFTWYAKAVNGHIIDFFWNGTAVPEARITFDATNPDHVPGQEQTVIIPWNYIKGGGNGPTVPVHYQLSVTDGKNDLKSATTPVLVNAIAIDLPAANFPSNPGPDDYLGCRTLEPDGALKVDIPDLSGLLKDGNTIKFRFTPMRGSVLGSDEDPIEEAIFNKDYTLGTEWPATGFTIMVEPYDDHILPLYHENADRLGRVKIEYFFHDGTEEIGSQSLTRMTAFYGPSAPCPITTP